jgi:hypothetical protein
MIRWLGVLLLLMLAMAPAALAQDPDDDAPEADEPEATATATPTPTPVPTAVPGCERGSGTDADYAYCPDPRCRPRGTDGDYAYDRCCREDGDEAYTDADYVYYCIQANTGGRFPPRKKRAAPPKSAVQPFAAKQLPLTGTEPLVIALMGFGFLLCGVGLELRRPERAR